MSKKIVVANWKLNPVTLTEAKKLASKISNPKEVTVVVCPPHLFLSQVKFANLGAQDAFWKVKGPYTGQVSAATLKGLKVKYCIVGHSEKRQFGDTDEMVKNKVETLVENGITPILCVGFGTKVEQDDLEVIDVLKEQLSAALTPELAKKVVVAYEPVWAISSGDPYAPHRIADAPHVEKVALFVKTRFSPKAFLYGGSVHSHNAKGFLEGQNVDGFLVGGSSLIAKDFNGIIEACK